MEHLNNRMKTLLRDQEKMTTEKGELNTKMDLEMKKHEHIYNYLQRQISEKDEEIEALKRQLKLSTADKAAQAEKLLGQLDQEKNDGSERSASLNKQIRELYEKTERLDSFDTVMEEKRALEEELTATRKRLVDTQEELDAWQRQTMVCRTSKSAALTRRMHGGSVAASSPRHGRARAAGSNETLPNVRSTAGRGTGSTAKCCLS
jgi:chromosome segregation ATPase